MPSLSSILIAFQAIPLTLFGASILISPADVGFDNLSAEQRHVVGTVAISLSLGYVVTAFQSRRARHWFLLAAAPMRLIGAWLFLQDDRSGTALWDGGNALVNFTVVRWERVARV
ncbi:hypothetical protein BU26DRAFT_229393 [Trematosphaeria pertusa]|uniref:Uncharacterized protein n=1 Tax=Trematosphaeria pertusa TaxID=390896 RepID=A0A6A6ITN7_9PLEO|nr:uncharacterized protein BU26DRAFT_229393 [Trematosphaeria pertusa]KAF2253766.1 hypothetical protein BU26DRAFT_229393 [Trematosphaeria pertusa]